MTATELQRIVVNLSNNVFVRYWLNFNRAGGFIQLQMAICCRDDEHSLEIPELENLGFKQLRRAGRIYYVIYRTNEDGTPYYSALG